MGVEAEVRRALNTALTGLGLRAYTKAPQAVDGGSTATFPYVEFGTIAFADFDDKEVNGFDFVVRMNIRSRSGSDAEATGIQGQIYARLHNGDLTIAGYRLILLRRENSFCERIADGSFHGVCEYRGLIEAT